MTIQLDRTNKGGYRLTAYENGGRICSGAGDTVKDAARWLVHHVNRLADAVEQSVMDAQWLTEDEVLAANGITPSSEAPNANA